MSEKLKIQCPACARTLTVSTAMIGRTGKCPGCANTVTVKAPNKELGTPPPPSPKSRVTPDVGVPLAKQPTAAHEISQDRRRIVAAVSVAPDKYSLVEPYLMDYEKPLAIAVQRQFPFSLFADIVLLSSHRLMMFKRFFTKIDMFDVNYIDFKDVTVSQGFFTSTLTIRTCAGRACSVARLVTDHALTIYRMCQDIETKARLARRQFELEENRSHTTQMQVNNLVSGPESRSASQNGIERLSRTRDISSVGDEEVDPFRLGE